MYSDTVLYLAVGSSKQEGFEQATSSEDYIEILPQMNNTLHITYVSVSKYTCILYIIYIYTLQLDLWNHTHAYTFILVYVSVCDCINIYILLFLMHIFLYIWIQLLIQIIIYKIAFSVRKHFGAQCNRSIWQKLSL